MKAYVLNRQDQPERLEAFRENYPASVLPECAVWKAKTGDDVTVPDWWKSSANRWALVQNFIDILEQDPEDDVLIFEDDCIFVDDFAVKYQAFLTSVPADWDMLYLGAQHLDMPRLVSDGVFRIRSCACGHAIIYRAKAKQAVADWLKTPKWESRHMPDLRRSQALAAGKFIAYSPLPNICGQSDSYSTLMKKERSTRWNNTFVYINAENNRQQIIDGQPRLNVVKPAEVFGVNTDYGEMSNVCSVALYGCNRFYALAFLLKQQELTNAFQFPIVCHCDKANLEFVKSVALQEDINLENVTMILHDDTDAASAMIWRFTPVGANVTHVFDIDNKLHPAHVDAINDFMVRQESAYCCKYVQRLDKILGGAGGYTKNILESLFEYWNPLYFDRWGYDEDLITKFLVEQSVPVRVYTTQGAGHRRPASWAVTEMPYKANPLHYTDADFADAFEHYRNGAYYLNGEAIPIQKTWRRF